MKRRFVDKGSSASQGVFTAPASGGRSRRHLLLALVLISAGLLVFVYIVLICSWLVEGDWSTPAVRNVKVSDAWLNKNENKEEWHRAQDEAERLNFPSPHGLPTTQVFFISCNRHDRSQLYWAYMAAAAQCEMLSRANATAAPPCRKLYSGESPLFYADDNAAPRDPSELPLKRAIDGDGKLWSKEVPLGACGSVYDTSEAALYRLQHQRTPPPGLLVDETLPPPHRPDGPQQGLRVAPHGAASSGTVPVDALVWLGDAIYADKIADGDDRQALLFQHANTMVSVGRFWRTQRDAPEYNAFISSCVSTGGRFDWNLHSSAETRPATEPHARKEMMQSFPPYPSSAYRNVWGTWDDHDMGKNDAGREYSERNSTQRFFLEFLRAPPNDPRWRREGVYQAYTIAFREVIDDTSEMGTLLRLLLQRVYEHAICVVLLDVRSFRDRPNGSHLGDMLGAAQWEWFEGLLQNYSTPTRDGQERCAMVLIGSGIQFMLDEKPAENWAAFPHSRDRLLGLLRAYGLERVTFITGDVHMGELGADFTDYSIRDVLGYPVVEATSSGLTHSANIYFLATLMPLLFPSRRRLSLYVEKNFGSLRLSLDRRQLPSIRSYLDDVKAFMSSTGPTAENLKTRLQTPQWHREARAALEQALNATFTIFSISNNGQPVYRLNFPLAMLTYAHGPAFRDATVTAVDGSVHLQPTVFPVTLRENDNEEAKGTAHATPSSSRTLLVLKNGTIAYIAHYTNTKPAPFITWLVRQMQYFLFTGLTVPETLKVMILCFILLSMWGFFILIKSGRNWWPLRQVRCSPRNAV